MLILTRRISEEININDNITVRVLGVHGCQVKLGIDAPKEMGIYRKEIYDRIQEEKTHAYLESEERENDDGND
jgi:carbon storage regulator